MAKWIKKQDPTIFCPQETHFRYKGTYWVKGWRKIVHADGNQKKAGLAILTSHKIDFKSKTITRDKESHIIIKGSIQQEDVTIIYAQTIKAPKYVKKHGQIRREK